LNFSSNSRHDVHVNRFLLIIILLLVYTLSVHADDERIWYDAKINGKPVRLILDTGAGPVATNVPFPVVLFSTAVKRLGLKFTPSDLNDYPNPGTTSLGTTEVCDLDLWGTHLRTSLGVLEAPEFLQWSADGILGWLTIRQDILSLDLTKDTVTQLDHVPKEAIKWAAFRVQTNSNILGFEVSDQNGSNSVVIVDTGNDGGISLCPLKWREWKATHTNRPTTLDARYMPGTGLVVREESWAREISLGSLALTDAPIIEANQTEAAMDPQFEASLGLAALKRLDMVIDGKQGIVYVRPKTTPPLSYQHNRLGAVFVPHDLQSDDLIAHVVDGSPAYEAGIRNGDILLKEGERDVTNWRDPSVKINTPFREQPAGTKLELTLKRGDKIFKTTAVLRNILPPDSPKKAN